MQWLGGISFDKFLKVAGWVQKAIFSLAEGPAYVNFFGLSNADLISVLRFKIRVHKSEAQNYAVEKLAPLHKSCFVLEMQILKSWRALENNKKLKSMLKGN